MLFLVGGSQDWTQNGAIERAELSQDQPRARKRCNGQLLRPMIWHLGELGILSCCRLKEDMANSLRFANKRSVDLFEMQCGLSQGWVG